MGVHTFKDSMPVKSAPAQKRTRRTRKTAPKAAPAVKVTTMKVATPAERTKPDAELISWQQYRQDFINRMNVHHYEMQELRKDFFRLVDFLTPYHNELVKRVKALG